MKEPGIKTTETLEVSCRDGKLVSSHNVNDFRCEARSQTIARSKAKLLKATRKRLRRVIRNLKNTKR